MTITSTAIKATKTLDELFAPFEARRRSALDAEAERRRGEFLFGWELNRLQGGVRSMAGTRLEELYAEGRVTKEEYLALAAKDASSNNCYTILQQSTARTFVMAATAATQACRMCCSLAFKIFF